MSIAALALRTAAVMTLRGATFAERRVYDSAIDPLDARIAEERVPLIVVTTDDSDAAPQGRDLLSADRSVDLIIETAVASLVRSKPGDAVEYTIPQTDDGLEWTLDLMGRQIMRVITAGDGVWPDLLRDLAGGFSKMLVRRGAGSEKGVKFAARQMILTASAALEPPPGEVPPAGSLYNRFLAAMASDPDLAAQANLVRAEIIGVPLPPWRQAAALLGIGPGVARAIQLTPEEPAPDTMPLDIDGVPATGGDAALPPEPMP